jgi:hypothetical protein
MAACPRVRKQMPAARRSPKLKGGAGSAGGGNGRSLLPSMIAVRADRKTYQCWLYAKGSCAMPKYRRRATLQEGHRLDIMAHEVFLLCFDVRFWLACVSLLASSWILSTRLAPIARRRVQPSASPDQRHPTV